MDLLRDQDGGILCAWRVTGPSSLTFTGERHGRYAWPRLVRLALRAERLLTRWADAPPRATCEACGETFTPPPGSTTRICDECWAVQEDP